MIAISLTTSLGVTTFLIPSPIEDTISLHYTQCDYCSTIIRSEKICAQSEPRRFCSSKDRRLYHFNQIDQTL